MSKPSPTRKSDSRPVSTPSESSESSLPPQQTLQDLLTKTEIDDFDLLLVGDGSGSKWGQGAGWASVAVLPDRLEREVFYGACNNATVNFAELAAYLAPISWFVSKVKSEDLRPRRGGLFEIHVITDSQYAQTKGGKPAFMSVTHNFLLVAGYQVLGHKGFNVTWHWLERDTSDLNKLVDELSRSARIGLSEAKAYAAARTKTGLTANTANPWE